MVKILILLALLAAALAVGDVEARMFAQHQLQQRVDARVPTTGAHVSISSFPFLGRLVVSGSVPKIQAHLVNVSAGPFTFDTIDLSVSGVRLDRTALVDNQVVVVKGIDSGTVSAGMTEAAVDRALGNLPVKLGDGTVQVTVRGITISGRLSVVGNQLRIETPVLPISVPLPRLSVLPCTPTPVVTTAHLNLSCTFSAIPSALLDVAGKVSA